MKRQTSLDHRLPDNAGQRADRFGMTLVAAAHAESPRGTHSNLLQILNHDQQP